MRGSRDFVVGQTKRKELVDCIQAFLADSWRMH